MEIQSLKLAYFSPTGTTKAVVHGISRGIPQYPTEVVDITRPDERGKPLHTAENELLIIAVPVYMGRVPALLAEWFTSVKARKTPVVCVVVYGNRAYENALLELKDMMKESGCKPIACAAYIGEHSFSSPELPTAADRPDSGDLRHAEAFGQKIGDKLRSVSSVNQLSDVEIPGSYPYGGVTALWSVDFIDVSDACANCGTCAEVCPVGAVSLENAALIDTEKCITCCACVKNCPQHARSMKAGPVRDAAVRLNTLYGDRKEPELFL